MDCMPHMRHASRGGACRPPYMQGLPPNPNRARAARRASPTWRHAFGIGLDRRRHNSALSHDREVLAYFGHDRHSDRIGGRGTVPGSVAFSSGFNPDTPRSPGRADGLCRGAACVETTSLPARQAGLWIGRKLAALVNDRNLCIGMWCRCDQADRFSHCQFWSRFLHVRWIGGFDLGPGPAFVPVQLVEGAGHMTQRETARSAGLVGCRRCGCVWPADATRCGRCNARLASRLPGRLVWVWLFWSLGVAAFLPANILPMLETRLFFETSNDTLVGGAFKLMGHGSYFLGLVILIASVAIPVAKLAAIAWLALSLQGRVRSDAVFRHRVFEAVELIGRWSMVDVFVVATLASLVQFSILASVTPGPASFAFALSVIFTMLSALSFDSRMIWDLDDPQTAGNQESPLP